MTSEGDYVLGTNDVEVNRLGFQHRVWREVVLGAWRRAGLREGMRVLDAGAGPGYVSLDFADVVGDAGEVIAVERSPKFLEVLHDRLRRRGVRNVRVIDADVTEAAPVGPVDLAWCRWVASFVNDVPRLVDWIAASVKPGGRAVFMEYENYGTWSFLPPRPAHRRFVREVMESWKDSGGRADVAPRLVEELRRAGFRMLHVRPHVFTAAPGDPFWRWPESFIPINLQRLQELGRIDADFARAAERELAEANADPQSRMITPLVLEICVEKPGG